MPSSSQHADSTAPIALVVGLILSLTILLSWSAGAQPCDSPVSLPAIEGNPLVYEDFVPPTGSLRWSNKTATNGDRIIHFIHGLGGNADSWNLVASRTAAVGAPGYPAREVVYANPPTYLQSGSTLDAAMDIHGYLTGVGGALSALHGIALENNFMVGHSYGGVLSLLLDSLYDDTQTFTRQFGGIVAFGSAINGAYLAKSLHPTGDNLAVAFVEEACRTLSDPKLVAPQFPSLRWIPGLDPLLRTAVDNACGLGSSFVPFALQKFNSPGMVELFPSAPLSKRLGKRAPSVPVVLAYGVEDEPVFWRTATSMYRSDSVGLMLANDPFSMDGDGDLVTFSTQQFDRYDNQKDQALQRASNYRTAAWILSPTLIGSLLAEWQAVVAEREAAAAEKAARWYRDANNSYKQMVGARIMQVSSEGYWCRCRDEYSAPTWYPVNNPADCFGDGDCMTFPIYEYQLVEKPNDGVVLAESAGILNGAVASVLMPGTNHQQMRNTSVTKTVLNRLMNGQIPGGAFFATPTR